MELGTDVGHVELWSYQPNDLQALKLSEISENSDDNSYMICYIYIYTVQHSLSKLVPLMTYKNTNVAFVLLCWKECT